MNAVQALPRESDVVLGRLAKVVAVHRDTMTLGDGRETRAAVGCLVRPEVGDLVLVADAPAVILNVLQREEGRNAELRVPGASGVHLRQQDITLEASRKLALRSLRDTELSAVTGTLNISARNLFTHVVESLVERAADRLSKVGTFALEAAELLRMRSRHGVVTADEQMHLDAKQLHLG